MSATKSYLERTIILPATLAKENDGMKMMVCLGLVIKIKYFFSVSDTGILGTEIVEVEGKEKK